MSIELIDRGTMNTARRNYTLNPNSMAGFKTAVNNGQTRLALEYAEILIDQLISRVSELEQAPMVNGESQKPAEETATQELKEKTVRPRKQISEKDQTEA